MPETSLSGTGPLLSLAQAAHRLGITRQGAWWLVNEGRIQAVRVGRAWLVSERAIEALKEERR